MTHLDTIAISPWFGSFFFVHGRIAHRDRGGSNKTQDDEVVIVFAGAGVASIQARGRMLPPGRRFGVEGPLKRARLVARGGGSDGTSPLSSPPPSTTVLKAYATTQLVPVTDLDAEDAIEATVTRIVLPAPTLVVELRVDGPSAPQRTVMFSLAHYPRVSEAHGLHGYAPIAPGDRLRLDHVHVVLERQRGEPPFLAMLAACAYTTVTHLWKTTTSVPPTPAVSTSTPVVAGLASLWKVGHDSVALWTLVRSAQLLDCPVLDDITHAHNGASNGDNSGNKGRLAPEVAVIHWNTIVRAYIDAHGISVPPQQIKRDWNNEFYAHTTHPPTTCWVAPHDGGLADVPPSPIEDLKDIGATWPALQTWARSLPPPSASTPYIHKCWTMAEAYYHSYDDTSALVGWLNVGADVVSPPLIQLVWRDARVRLDIAMGTDAQAINRSFVRAVAMGVLVYISRFSVVGEAFATSFGVGHHPLWITRFTIAADLDDIKVLSPLPSMGSLTVPRNASSSVPISVASAIANQADRCRTGSHSQLIHDVILLEGRVESVDVLESLTAMAGASSFILALHICDVNTVDTIVVYVNETLKDVVTGLWPGAHIIIPVRTTATCSTRHAPVQVHGELLPSLGASEHSTSTETVAVRLSCPPEDTGRPDKNMRAHLETTLNELMEMPAIPSVSVTLVAQVCLIIDLKLSLVCAMCHKAWNNQARRCSALGTGCTNVHRTLVHVKAEFLVEDGLAVGNVIVDGVCGGARGDKLDVLHLLDLHQGPFHQLLMRVLRGARDGTVALVVHQAVAGTNDADMIKLMEHINCTDNRLFHAPLTLVCLVRARGKTSSLRTFSGVTHVMDPVLLLHPMRKHLELRLAGWAAVAIPGRIDTLLRRAAAAATQAAAAAGAVGGSDIGI